MDSIQDINESLGYLKDYGGSDSENESNSDVFTDNLGKFDQTVSKVVIEEVQDNVNNNQKAIGSVEVPTPALTESCLPTTVFDDESLEESAKMKELVRKNNIINACAHGPVSVVSFMHGEISERRMIIQDGVDELLEYHVSEYRDDTGSDDDSSDSDMESVKELECLSDSDDDEGATAVPNCGAKNPVIKSKGELGLEDLPPIEDLSLSVPEQQCIEIGKICNIVEQMVVIQALPDMPSLNIDTVLFLEKGAKTLGQIFDVFGQVTEPYYCVRFNSNEHVKEKGIEAGMTVYCAPKTSFTNYVFLSELMKVKGSDASWVNDDEPPPQFLDYSDDEAERKAKKDRRDQRKPDKEGEQRDNEKRPPAFNARRARPVRRISDGPVRPAAQNHFRSNAVTASCDRYPPAAPPGASPFALTPPALLQFSRPPPGFDDPMPSPSHHPAFGGMPFFCPPPRFMPPNRMPLPFFGWPAPPPPPPPHAFRPTIGAPIGPRPGPYISREWDNGT